MNETRRREVWIDGRLIPPDRLDLWELVKNGPFRRIVLTAEQWREGRFPLKTEPVVEVRGEGDLESLAGAEIVLSDRRGLLAEARRRGHKTCAVFEVDSAETLETACREAWEHDFAVVDFALPTNIPLELIIARLEGSRTVLLRRVGTVEEMQVAFGVLEKGSDGVLFAAPDPAALRRAAKMMLEAGVERLAMERLQVKEVLHAGMGWRACIDTTSLMSREEGMLIGSTSGGGIFVCSETHYLPYMKTRPFRVNAGAVHSYVWCPGGITCYLTELEAGSAVLCVAVDGHARTVTVGRVKMEIRPLLMIKGVAADRELNVIVQDDWHIRLMGADGAPRNATTLKRGDELLAFVCPPGRHVGLAVGETILEQ